MKYLSKRILTYLQRNDIILITPENESIYLYGFQTAIYTIFSTIFLILIGILLNRSFETILLISIFYTNQTFGGGFHANSHTKCLLTMIAGLLLFVYLHNYYPPIITIIILVSASFTILFLCPLVLHNNKQYLSVYKSQLIIRSRISILVEVAMMLAYLMFQGKAFIRSISYALCLSALSRIIGKLTIIYQNARK